jgi:hypothetical protein
MNINNIELAIPNACHLKWQNMQGDKKTRYCNECHTKIYNFSEMSQDEINNVMAKNAKVCARMDANTKAYVSKYALTQHYFKKKNIKAALLCIMSMIISPVTNALDINKKALNQHHDKSNAKPVKIESTPPDNEATNSSKQDKEPEKVGEIIAPDTPDHDESTDTVKPTPVTDDDNEPAGWIGSVAVPVYSEPDSPKTDIKKNNEADINPE